MPVWRKDPMYLKFCSLYRILLITGAGAGMAIAATSSQAQNYPPDAPPPTARLTHLQGNVSIQPNGVDSWGQAGQNMPVGPGDRVYTDQQGEGELQVEQTRAYFSPNSDLTLTNVNDQGIELGLASGSVSVFSDGFPPNQSLFVSTPNGGITLPTRGSFRVDVYPDQQSTVVTVWPNGADVQLNGAGDFHMILRRGESLQLSGTNPVYTQPLEIGPFDEFAHWSGALETHRFNSVSARYCSPEMHGYDDLDGAGDWQPQSDYGPIWFPHVEAGWAPYHNGHWVNRPFYGWTWVADEPWGAAPFHYGRWVVVGGRWGWIPGPREVHPIWSPAQVVFAGGIQVGGVGVSVWFPLGPGEPYHPWYPASPTYINQINITNIHESKVVHVQNTYVTNTVVNNTTINNITYVNRTVGATAMRQEDFAAGHNAKAVAVKVDPVQLQHAQPARPEVKPPAQPIILHPVAKPAAVPATRPVLINHQGQAAPAAPNAKPVVVPVKAAAPVAPKPIPGHAPIGTPTVGGKPVTVPAKPQAEPNPPAPGKPQQPAHVEPAKPTPPAPTPTPVNPPRPNAPANKLPPPAPTPTPVAPAKPTPPPAKVTPPPPTTPVRPQPVAPQTRPAPPQSKPPAPETKPAPPQPRPAAPPAKNAPKKDEKKQ